MARIPLITATLALLISVILNSPVSTSAAGTSGLDKHNGTLQLTPSMSLSALAAHPDTTPVLLPASGKTIPLGTLRRLTALGSTAKQAGSGQPPRAITLSPSASGHPVTTRQELTQALKEADGATLRLPSGKTITAAMLRYLQPLVEQRLGRPLASSQAGKKSGTIVRIQPTTTKKEWQQILQKPDSTLLENPQGKRITVGQLKQAFQEQFGQETPSGGWPVRVAR